MVKRLSSQQLKAAFARRLTTAREDLGLSQEAFAARLGISQTRYSKYESGRSVPPLDVIAQLPELTGRSIDYLVTGGERVSTEPRPFTPPPLITPPA